ncbi:TPA: SidA/IucD/PvdA family monooxygenase [Stenotrophomonas maltophilia]|nr:SidA/IucD/PvdA family monooxygenase [Stenotrophomonas maltophilia]HEL7633175.1 SidA/IucD/PvdA family monooxygenase [Stenotrophomonas maltophilia]
MIKSTAATEEKPTQINLAVIGAGAKAAAISARAHAATEHGRQVDVTIFEKTEIGANWTGGAGYTNGNQRLCTQIERDLIFPLNPPTYGIDTSALESHSWNSFLYQRCEYQKWVDSGRLPPTHKEFAEYLSWSIKKSKAAIVNGEATKFSESGGKWKIKYKPRGSTSHRTHPTMFDGIVITGPGPARRIPRTGAPVNSYDGHSFWLKENQKHIEKTLKKLRVDDQILIIGAGGTSAAILAWLIKNGQQDRTIIMLADQPAFFTRGNSVFENRLFNDDNTWKTLPEDAREKFVSRLNRGVVWDAVMEQVSQANSLLFHYGRAERIRYKGNSISVKVHSGFTKSVTLSPAILIDASGFDPFWFMKMFEDLSPALRKDTKFHKKLSSEIGSRLSFTDSHWKLPPLHAPMLASAEGPGFSNLMSLGSLADRILGHYLAT